MKTPITYYGGKQSIIHELLPMVPYHTIYTEAFFGGGTMFFEKDPVLNETINDRLDVVVNFYRQIKFNYANLKKLIDASLISRTELREAIRVIKQKDKCQPVAVAWAFWYCCNFSFMNKIGGGLKYSKDTTVLVPRMLQNKKNEFTELLVQRLQNTTIECNEAVYILKTRNARTAFHFIDTPYVGSDQGHYKGFSEKDFIDVMDACADLKGKFLLTHYQHPILSEAIDKNGWYMRQITYKLKSARKGRNTKTEWLVTNYDPEYLLMGDQVQLNFQKVTDNVR